MHVLITNVCEETYINVGYMYVVGVCVCVGLCVCVCVLRMFSPNGRRIVHKSTVRFRDTLLQRREY